VRDHFSFFLKSYRFRLHRNDKLEGNSWIIFTSRHLSRRNFQWFDSQSTVNSQQSTVNIIRSATGIDISGQLADIIKFVLTPTLTPNCSRISACSLPLINSCLGRTRGQKPWWLSFFGALSEVEVSKPCINISQRDPRFLGSTRFFWLDIVSGCTSDRI